MDMQTLSSFASICFRISVVIFVIGVILTALTYWKLNIREVYLIRSGKARRRTIVELEEHNRETGKLRDNLDLDYTTGSLKKTSRRLGRSSEMTGAEPVFRRELHSGDTGTFSTPVPSAEQESRKDAHPADTRSQTPAAETPYQRDSSETVQLDNTIPATSGDYASRISTAYQEAETGELGKETAPPQPEPTIPVDIISCELIIHTNEIIEI